MDRCIIPSTTHALSAGGRGAETEMRFQAWRLLPAKSALSQSAVANLSFFPSGGRVGLPLEVLVANQVVGLHSELYAKHGTKEVRRGYLYGRMEDGARSCTGRGGEERGREDI